MSIKRWSCALLMTLFACFLASFRLHGQAASTTLGIESSRKPLFRLPFDLYDHWILVKGSIGSLENVPILIDTGTSPTAVSKKIAEQLKLHGNREPLFMSNGKIEVETVILPHIAIGPLRSESLRVVVRDLSFLEKNLGLTVGGIAGLDILTTTSMQIDYWKRRIVFGPVKLGKKFVPFETQKPFLTVKAKVGGQAVRLLVDSGTAGLLLYSNRVHARLERLPTDPDAWVSTAAGIMPTTWFRASQVSFGDEDLGPQSVLVAEVEPDRRYEFDGLLGFTRTGFRRVWLDFENGFFGWD